MQWKLCKLCVPLFYKVFKTNAYSGGIEVIKAVSTHRSSQSS